MRRQQLTCSHRQRWMRRKSDSSLSFAHSLESKGRRISFPIGALSRERLLSNRKRAQMVKECRKLQLKVVKLTRYDALPHGAL
jgi:hypothetical protein